MTESEVAHEPTLTRAEQSAKSGYSEDGWATARRS